ncbi:unnamed protein product, partial [Amoebophrya sp. A25]
FELVPVIVAPKDALVDEITQQEVRERAKADLNILPGFMLYTLKRGKKAKARFVVNGKSDKRFLDPEDKKMARQKRKGKSTSDRGPSSPVSHKSTMASASSNSQRRNGTESQISADPDNTTSSSSGTFTTSSSNHVPCNHGHTRSEKTARRTKNEHLLPLTSNTGGPLLEGIGKESTPQTAGETGEDSSGDILQSLL